MISKRKKKCLTILAALVVLGGVMAWFGWYKFFRSEPEPRWANESERF